MRSTYERHVAEQSEIERNIVHGNARLCSGSQFGKVCKTLWPFKTAEQLASRVGCTVRTAAYEISGERHPSAQSILAVVTEITPKWKQ
jgi:hypothetical protein